MENKYKMTELNKTTTPSVETGWLLKGSSFSKYFYHERKIKMTKDNKKGNNNPSKREPIEKSIHSLSNVVPPRSEADPPKTKKQK